MHRISEGGKEATVFLDEKDLAGDVDTVRQIRRMIKDPTVDHARVMPDCHFGSGCCVGFTSRLTDKVVPRFIGGDIGCGLSVHPLSADERHGNKAEAKADRIRARVPVGDAMHEHADAEAMASVYAQANALAEKFGQASWLYDDAYLADLCKRTGFAESRARAQLGTLGGGNHFLEVGVDDDGVYYASVHSGSRGIGQAVCRFHQDIITRGTKGDHRAYEKEVRKMERRVKDKEQRRAADDELRRKHLEPSHPPYLEGDEALAYYRDMIFAQSYARVNRWKMLCEVVGVYGADPDPGRVTESSHNYIDFEDRVWRKGAVRAHEGEKVVVALNMRDGIAVGVGRGAEEWNRSAPHGAGRRVARGDAKRHTTMKEFEAAMAGVAAATVRPETLDESPAMYKDSELVLERSVEAFRVVTRIRPVVNIKGF